jgi:hypothetical protein
MAPAPIALSYKREIDNSTQYAYSTYPNSPIIIEFRGFISLSTGQQTFPIIISTAQPNFILCKSSHYRAFVINERGLKVEEDLRCQREFVISSSKEMSGLRIAPAENLAKAISAATLLDLQKIDPMQYSSQTASFIGSNLSKEIAKVLFNKIEKTSLESSLTLKAGGKTNSIKFISEIVKWRGNYERINFEYSPKSFPVTAQKFSCPKKSQDPVVNEFCRRQPYLELKPRIEKFLGGDWAKDQNVDAKLANAVDNEGLTVGMRLARQICAPQRRLEESGFSAGEDEIAPKKAKAIEALFRAAKEDYKDALGRTLKFYAAYYGCDVDLKKLGNATKDSSGLPLLLYALAGKNKNHIKATWTEDASAYLKDPPSGRTTVMGDSGGIPQLSEHSILELLFESQSSEAIAKFESIIGKNPKNLRYFNEASSLANSLNPEVISFLKKIRISLWSSAYGNQKHVLAHALADGIRRNKDKALFEKLESDFANGPDGIVTVCNTTHNPDQCLVDNNFCPPIRDRSKKVHCMRKTGRGEELPVEGDEWKIADMQPGRSESFCAPIKAKDLEYSACLLRHVYKLPEKDAETHLKKLLAHEEGAALFLSELAPYSRVSSLISPKILADICLNSPYSLKAVKSKNGTSGFVADLCINMLRQKPTQEILAKAPDCNTSGESKDCIIPLLLSPISESIVGLKRLCDQNNPLACTRVAFSHQLSSREEMTNAAKRICEASDYTMLCEMGHLADSEELSNEKLVQIAKSSPSFGRAVLQRIEKNLISLKEVEPYATDFERSCEEHSGNCKVATLIYKNNNDSAGIDRITNAAFERCRDSLQCLDFSNLIASAPKFEKQARKLCSSGNVGLCKALRSGSTLDKNPFSYSDGKKFCTSVQAIYRDECLFTLLSFIGSNEEDAKDFCLSNDKFQYCEQVFVKIAKNKISPEDRLNYQNSCSDGSKNGACMVLAYHLINKDRKIGAEYLQQSCRNSGYFPTVCERSLNALIERKMVNELQSFFTTICSQPTKPWFCSSQVSYRLRASNSPADLKALEAECKAKNRNSCLSLAQYYKDNGMQQKSKPILKEYCETNANKAGCPGIPGFFGPNLFGTY